MRRHAALALALALTGCGKGNQSAPTVGSGSSSGAVASDAPPAIDLSSFAVPEVASRGYEPNPPTPRVIATRTALVVDGKHVLALEGGALPAGALVGGEIPALISGLSAGAAGASPRTVLALDKSLTYGLLFQLLSTLKSQGLRSFGIAARANGASVMLPIDLPTAVVAPSIVPEKSGTKALLGASVEVSDATVSPESSLSGDQVKTKVSGAYLAPIKACVAKVGPRDASPGGTIALAFAVDETGRAAEPSVTGLPKDVAACVTAAVAAWRFTAPRGPERETLRVNAKVTLSIAFHELGPRDAVEDAEAPAPAPAPATPPPPAELPTLRVIVRVTPTQVIVSPHAPIALGPTASAELGALLERTVKTAGTPASRGLIVMADAQVSMQTLAEILGAVRMTATGAELFPTPALASSPE